MSIFATQALTVCAVRQPAGWRGKGDGGQWSSRRWGDTGSRKQKKLRRGLDEVGGRWGVGGRWRQKKEMTFFATPALTVLNRQNCA